MDKRGDDPKTLGRYEVVRRLAKGAMGVVYVGRDPKLDRQLALKTLQVSDIIDRESAERLRDRFLEEPRITARLRHPNVVPVYDAGIDPGTGIAWLALELVEGFDLSKLMTTGLTPRRVLDIADDVAAGLDHAHQRGIIHRDVKPANILIDRDGRARLTDFGIAHEMAADRTRPGEFLGSPAYMAPEQIGGGGISSRTDIHALGAVLYEALTGKRPFEATKTATTAQAVLSLMPEAPSRVAAHLPRSLDAVFKKALAKNPEGRHETASQLAREVRQALTSLKPAIDHDAQTTLALAGRGRLPWIAQAKEQVASSLSRLFVAARQVRHWDRRKQAALGVGVLLATCAAAAWAWRGPAPVEPSMASEPATGESSPTEPDSVALDQPAELPLDAPEGLEPPSDELGQPAQVAAGAVVPAPTTDEARTQVAAAREPRSSQAPSATPSKPAEAQPSKRPPPRVQRETPPNPPAPVAETQLFLDIYTTRSGLLSLDADGRQLFSAPTGDLKPMRANFRGFVKKRYRAEVAVPSKGAPIHIRFQPDKSDEVLEATVNWDLPPGGQALAAVELGLRGREIEVELLEQAQAKGP